MRPISLSHETANREKDYFRHQQTPLRRCRGSLSSTFHCTLEVPKGFIVTTLQCVKKYTTGPSHLKKQGCIKPSAFYPELLSVGNHWGLTPASPSHSFPQFWQRSNLMSWMQERKEGENRKNRERGNKIKVGASSVAANLLHMEGMAFPCKICPPPLCVSIVLQMMMNLSTFTRICLHSVVCARSSSSCRAHTASNHQEGNTLSSVQTLLLLFTVFLSFPLLSFPLFCFPFLLLSFPFPLAPLGPSCAHEIFHTLWLTRSVSSIFTAGASHFSHFKHFLAHILQVWDNKKKNKKKQIQILGFGGFCDSWQRNTCIHKRKESYPRELELSFHFLEM